MPTPRSIARLNDVRLAQFNKLTAAGRTPDEITTALERFDAFADAFGDAIEDVRGMLSDLTDAATAIKTKETVNADRIEQRRMLIGAGERTKRRKCKSRR